MRDKKPLYAMIAGITLGTIIGTVKLNYHPARNEVITNSTQYQSRNTGWVETHKPVKMYEQKTIWYQEINKDGGK